MRTDSAHPEVLPPEMAGFWAQILFSSSYDLDHGPPVALLSHIVEGGSI